MTAGEEGGLWVWGQSPLWPQGQEVGQEGYLLESWFDGAEFSQLLLV